MSDQKQNLLIVISKFSDISDFSLTPKTASWSSSLRTDNFFLVGESLVLDRSFVQQSFSVLKIFERTENFFRVVLSHGGPKSCQISDFFFFKNWHWVNSRLRRSISKFLVRYGTKSRKRYKFFLKTGLAPLRPVYSAYKN